MLERWKGKGYAAYLTPADIPGRGRWYRVRIGGFGSRDEAARYLKELSSRESVDALVVLNDQ
jgi:cell division septation protein DedD